MLARLNHPYIIILHDFGKVDGLFYLLMEYVDGVSLRQLLQSKKLRPEAALAIVPKMCEALQFAHEHGVVHRDIKPENVLLDKEGRVKIADFGIAKMVGAEAGQPAITRDEQVIGTPHYMAPEQVEKPQRVDHRADIYSLGVVFYEMLTGELPLGKFAPPSQRVQIDVRLDEVVLHALEKDPERRYQQASQVKTDVETITTTPALAATGFVAAAQPSGFPFGASSWLETVRWTARLLGLSLLLFVVVVFGLFLFGAGLPPLALQSGGALFNYLAIALMLLGFILGWKFEGTAAVLIAAAWVLWHSSNGSLAWSMFHLGLLVAGLYASCWWAGQGRRTWVLVTAASVLVVLLVCGIVFLPTNIYLYGTVLDAATRQPIPDAELIVSRRPFPPRALQSSTAARSSSTGYYALLVGWYTPEKQVRVTAQGYSPLQMTLGPRLLGSRRIRHELALSPAPEPPRDDRFPATPTASRVPETPPPVSPTPEKPQFLEYLIRNPWWGLESSEKIASQYLEEWLPRLSNANSLVRLGFALYDTQRYSDALKVFCRLEEVGDKGEALVWQGHMLDLLGRRTEAVAAYQKSLTAGVEKWHDQYGLALNNAYIEQRLKQPFTRVENKYARPITGVDYVKALAGFDAMREQNEALRKAYAIGDLKLISSLTPSILESVRSYNALVRGTVVEIPQSGIDRLASSLEAARSGDLQRAKTLFDSISESGGAELRLLLEAQAREMQRASPGVGSKTNAMAR
jgi:hypothetical protein